MQSRTVTASASPDGSTGNRAGAAAPAQAARWRIITAWVLIVVATIVALGASLDVWVKRQALDTNNWVATSSTMLENDQIRQALAAYLVNQLTANVLHGTSTPAQTFIPKGMPGYDPSDDTQKFDPAAAKKLLSDAGVTAAQLGSLKLLTRDSTGSKTLNEFISAQWQQNLGVNIQLDVIDSKTVTSRIRKGQFDIYGPDGWGADYSDQQDWFDIFTSSACHSLNWGCVALSGYDDTIKQADAGKTDAARNKLYTQAQKQLVDQAAVGFMYQQGEYNLIEPYVQGLSITPLDDEFIPGDLYMNQVFISKH